MRRDGGASQIVVIGIIGAAALLMMGFLTIPMIVGGSSLLFSAGTGGFGCSGSAQQAKSALQSKVSGQAKNSIPSNYLTWYQKVGQQYGVPWVILAGIGTVESDNGRSSLPGVHSGANAFGAAGPMQIGIGGAAGNSWGGAPVAPGQREWWTGWRPTRTATGRPASTIRPTPSRGPRSTCSRTAC